MNIDRTLILSMDRVAVYYSCHHHYVVGVSLQSFVNAYTVAMTPFNVFLASPEVRMRGQ